MKKKYYTESSHQFIFSLFFSSKKKKLGMYRDHHHTETELGFILNGTGEYILGDKKLEAEPDCLFVVRSNEHHCIPTITSNVLVSFNIQLSSYFLWNICSDYIPPNKLHALINPCIGIENRVKSPEIVNKFKEIASLCESENEPKDHIIRRKVLEALILIADEISPSDQKQNNVPPRFNDIQLSIDFIKKNYMKPITIEDIAKSAAMSPSYMSGIFKAVTGVSPYNYLSVTRIEKSVELLKHTNKSIVDVALECGFTNITSFNKMFKQLVGITPSDLRKSYNDGNL